MEDVKYAIIASCTLIWHFTAFVALCHFKALKFMLFNSSAAMFCIFTFPGWISSNIRLVTKITPVPRPITTPVYYGQNLWPWCYFSPDTSIQSSHHMLAISQFARTSMLSATTYLLLFWSPYISCPILHVQSALLHDCAPEHLDPHTSKVAQAWCTYYCKYTYQHTNRPYPPEVTLAARRAALHFKNINSCPQSNLY